MALAIVAGAALAVLLTGAGSARVDNPARAVRAQMAAPGPNGSSAKIAFLAKQTSNRCGLQPTELMRMPDGMRLQGSCCFPMNLQACRAPVHGLEAYRRIVAIPHDPYDIPVATAEAPGLRPPDPPIVRANPGVDLLEGCGGPMGRA